MHPTMTTRPARWHRLKILALAAGIAALGAGPAAAEPVDLSIGFSATLAGAGSDFGLMQRMGTEMAVEQYNAKPDRVFDVDLTVYDEHFNPEVGADNFIKLTSSDDAVAIVGVTLTGVGQRLATLAAENKIPVVTSVSGGPNVIGTTEDDYMFRVSMPEAEQAERNLAWIKEKGWKKIALLHDTDAYGASGADEIVKRAAKYEGLEIVCREAWATGDSDMTGQLQSCRGQEPEVLMFQGHANEVAQMRRSMAQLGWDLPTVGSWSIIGPEFTDLAGQFGVGVYFTSSFTADSSPAAKAFDDSMREKYGAEYLLPVVAAQAFDATNMVIAAAEQAKAAGEVTGTAVRDALENLDAAKLALVTSAKPFAKGRHDALSADAIFISRYDDQLVPQRLAD